MKYPMFNNWLEFRQINKDEIDVIDSLSGAEYTMGIILMFINNIFLNLKRLLLLN